MKHTNITIRVPVALVEALDRLAQAESERTGLRIDRSNLVRRAITKDIERRKVQPKQEGGSE